MKKTTRYHIRYIRIALGRLAVLCLALSALVYGAYALMAQDWLPAACCGVFCALVAWNFSMDLKLWREDLRAAKEGEAAHAAPAVCPCPVSTEVLVANLRSMATAHPETASLNTAATCYLCWPLDPEFDFFNTFALLREGDDWCASFGDIQTYPGRPCIPSLAVRHLFVRETGYIEPSLIRATETLVQGLVFHHEGHLHIYPASLAHEFMLAYQSSLFARRPNP